jgi:hypothetical protein
MTSSKQVPRWVPTRARGCFLKRLRIESCGKRGRIIFELADGSTMRCALSNRVELTSMNGVRQSFRSLDDVNVELVLEPEDGRRILIESADVDYWLADEYPDEPIPNTIEKLEELKTAFDFRIGFRCVE